MISQFMSDRRVRSVIFVGCGSMLDAENRNAHIVEDAVAAHTDVLAAIDVLAYKDIPWPFVRGDGRRLPLRDASADLVVANAVIEHVGDERDQRQFVDEQTRVGRAWVITTPNRWFPVESHTSAIMLHWLRGWRSKRREFTRLLSRREFRDLLPKEAVIVGRPWSATFVAFYAPN